MELEHHFEECNECKKEFVVSIALIGVSHNAKISVICKECLKKTGITKEFRKQSPKDAKKIEEWLSKKYILIRK